MAEEITEETEYQHAVDTLKDIWRDNPKKLEEKLTRLRYRYGR